MIGAILGPTASGKSEIGLALAVQHGGSIVSVDSMQVYRGMDIGTAKPTPEERVDVPHYMVDLVEPEDEFTVADFQAAGRCVLHGNVAAGPFWIVGGSGLHFRALVDPMDFPPTDPEVRAGLSGLEHAELTAKLVGVDPDAASHVDLANPRRVVRALEIHELTGDTPSTRATRPEAAALREYRAMVEVRAVGFDPGEALPSRVEERCDRMLAAGLLEEVAVLAGRLGPTARQAVGYKELLPVVAGEIDVDEGRARVVAATLALAKRQRTFFRRDPRIRWLPWSDDPGSRVEQATEVFEETAWSS